MVSFSIFVGMLLMAAASGQNAQDVLRGGSASEKGSSANRNASSTESLCQIDDDCHLPHHCFNGRCSVFDSGSFTCQTDLDCMNDEDSGLMRICSIGHCVNIGLDRDFRRGGSGEFHHGSREFHHRSGEFHHPHGGFHHGPHGFSSRSGSHEIIRRVGSHEFLTRSGEIIRLVSNEDPQASKQVVEESSEVIRVGGQGSFKDHCERDQDCRHGQFCRNGGRCRDRDDQCSSDRGCPSNLFCSRGRCLSRSSSCRRDLDCRRGQFCARGRCVDDTCRRDFECGQGEDCFFGRCVPQQGGFAVEMMCMTDRDCHMGAKCVKSMCMMVVSGEKVAPEVSNEQDAPAKNVSTSSTLSGADARPRSCRGDGECPNGWFCSDGRCKQRSRPCVELCIRGSVCVDGRCVRRECGRNEQFVECSSGCEPSCDNLRPTCFDHCLPPSCQCQAGFVRLNGECIRPQQCPGNDPSPGDRCRNNGDCRRGAICEDGRCQIRDGRFCSSSRDCGVGQRCADGRCLGSLPTI